MKIEKSSDGKSAVYKSIRTLPLTNLVRLLVDEEDTAVIKFGTPGWQQIKAAKEILITQFQKKWHNQDQMFAATLKSSVITAKFYPEIDTIETLIHAAKSGEEIHAGDVKIHIPSWINQGLFTRRKFDEVDPESFERDIRNCSYRLQDVSSIVRMRDKWIAALDSKEQDGYTSEYMEAIFSIVFGLGLEHINFDMTTYQFCECATAYIQYSVSLADILYMSGKALTYERSGK